MTTVSPPTPVRSGASLSGGKLPRWAPAAVAVLAVGLALLLNVTTDVSGRAGTLLVAVLLFIVLQSAWSFRSEGRRHAVDRFATTLVYSESGEGNDHMHAIDLDGITAYVAITRIQ